MDAMSKYTPEQIVLAIEILDDLERENKEKYNTKELASLNMTVLLLLRHYKKITDKNKPTNEKATF